MPRLDDPNTDLDREAFLVRAQETGLSDRKAGRNYVSEETLTSVGGFLGEFRPAVKDSTGKLGARAKETREASEAVKPVGVYTRDIWEGIKRRAAREDLPAEVLTYYKLPLSGEVPKPGGREAWITLAKQVVEGDADAVKAGFEAMSNPSAAQLAKVVERARKELSDVAGADREYDKAQEVVSGLRSGADELIDEVVDELKFNLRKMDDSSRRRIMRTYGVQYRYLKGEPQDTDDPTPAE